MADEDPYKLANELEGEANELAEESRELGRKVDDTRQDWERKRADDSVPGAPPRPEPTDDPDRSDADDAADS